MHFFATPEAGQLVGKLNWRIPKGEDFIERGTMQSFVQDPQNPGTGQRWRWEGGQDCWCSHCCVHPP